MNEKKKNPFLNFTIFAVAVHAVTWGSAFVSDRLMLKVNKEERENYKEEKIRMKENTYIQEAFL